MKRHDTSPNRHTQVSTADTEEFDYQRFRSGQTWPVIRVSEMLKSYGIDGKVKSVQCGYFRKMFVRLETSAGPQVLKVALHPYAVRLLRQEQEGYAAYPSTLETALMPQYTLEICEENVAISRMDEIAGYPPKRISVLSSPPSRMVKPTKIVPAVTYLDRLLQKGDTAKDSRLATLEARIREIISIDGDQLQCVLEQSHGDFVYWNCLRATGNTYLLDLEYHSEARMAGYDDWHWCLAPAARVITSMGLRPAATNMMLGAALEYTWLRLVRPRYLRACRHLDLKPLSKALQKTLFLLERIQIVEEEHQLEDIIGLIGQEAYDSRKLGCDLMTSYLESVYR